MDATFSVTKAKTFEMVLRRDDGTVYTEELQTYREAVIAFERWLKLQVEHAQVRA